MLKPNHNRAGSPPPRRSSGWKSNSNATLGSESGNPQEPLDLTGTNMVGSGGDGPARDQEKESGKEEISVKTSADLMGSPSSDDPVKSKGGIQADEDDEYPEISELSNVRIPGVDDDGASQQTKRKSWMTWVIIVIAVLLCVSLGVGVWFMNHPQSHRLDNSSKVGGNAIGSSQGSDSNVDPVSDVLSFMDDKGVPKYYQQPESKVDQPTREQITKDSIESAPENAEMSLVSKASNPDLTDDPSKAQNEDGTLNPNYSYVTMDNAVPLIRDDLERIVNSVYGGWSALQDPGRIGVDNDAPAFAGAGLADMFDPSVDVGSEEALRSHLPLVADWDRNGFGGALADKDPDEPVLGVLNGYDCEFNVKGDEADTVTCVADATYSWKDTSGKTHELGKKTLTLHYKVNYEDPSGRRLLLTSVEQ